MYIATYVDKILKGAKVRGPSGRATDQILNYSSELGIEIPVTLLARAKR
jgi:hypothetical protein